MSTDNDLCLPVISGDKIKIILAEVAEMVGIKHLPQVYLDLEQIQVLDYTTLPLLSADQVEFIQNNLNSSPYNTEELAYFALRSLFAFCWEEPKCEDDVKLAATFEFALMIVLIKYSRELAGELIYKDSRLPYWVRLSFLRVLSRIPVETIEKYSLDRICCFPIKRKSFNANSTILRNGAVIGFSYALEPILKVLNRFFLHFYSTQHLSGDKRYQRAWSEIVPVVLHFSIGIEGEKISGFSMLFDKDVVIEVQSITTEQIDFIMSHEIGHIVYEHPKLIAEINNPEHAQLIRPHYEYQADIFANEILRSRLVNEMRYRLSPNRKNENDNAEECLDNAKIALSNYANSIEAVRLLFTYMNFIEKANHILKTRLHEKFPNSNNAGTHPLAADRYKNLEKFSLIDVSFESERLVYAKTFFSNLPFCMTKKASDLRRRSSSG